MAFIEMDFASGGSGGTMHIVYGTVTFDSNWSSPIELEFEPKYVCLHYNYDSRGDMCISYNAIDDVGYYDRFALSTYNCSNFFNEQTTTVKTRIEVSGKQVRFKHAESGTKTGYYTIIG